MTRPATRFTLALLLGALPLLAQPGPGCPRGERPRQGHMMGRMAECLKLTADQKARIQELHTRHREANEPKLKAAQEARKALQEAMRTPATPPERLKALHQTVSDLRFEQMMARRTLHEAVQAVLTPEQRAQAERLRAERQEQPQGRRGGGKRGGFGPRF